MKMLSGTGEGGVVDMGSMLAQGQQPAQEPTHVFLLEVACPADGAIHKSVHVSVEGAGQRFDRLAADWGAAPENLTPSLLRLPLEP
ncbi:hypothetical protein MINTM019_00790 [Mycobacterium paraintracellulare]|nr:hypothetical protein MINTM003_00780 [Mycobacterium paraintracellulare]BCO81745.1 hypothetical protein MINTM011_00800 [Mycobacterium paraintracellulare]BCO86821.1 hypothetical protein MINTM015_00780 [Mycobacterium paraintracellulare]BCP02623.1 hypothetical protein MINTM019_00790 [Mycobacterium paraintracellulare]